MIHKLKKADLPTLRAAWWTWRALRKARGGLRSRGFEKVDLPAVPAVGIEAQRGVAAVLRRCSNTCLEQATVRQAWHAAHGLNRDLIIGVTAPKQGFSAHAWLEGDPPCQGEGFSELTRRPASA